MHTLIESLSKYLQANKNTKISSISLFNDWSVKSGFIVKDSQSVLWLLTFIDRFQTVDKAFMNEAVYLSIER